MDADNMRWLNQPLQYKYGDGSLKVITGDKTDFWRETFYGFWRDSGHFFHRRVDGDFTVQVFVKGTYESLYDQAGLMIRLSETHWIKAGIELTDGRLYFSVVVTNDVSDWSLVSIPADENGIGIRLTRHREAIRVQYLDASDQLWKPVRLAYFPPSEAVDVGLMCCSPEREGFEATFRDFQIGPPIARELHD